MASKLELVRKYFQLLERFATDPSDFAPLLHADFRQRELPNQLNRQGQESDLADLLKRAAAGKKMLSRQRFEIRNHVESGDQLVVEAGWTGVMAIDAGPFKASQEIRAHFCIVLEFQDGKLHRQRNYDCFEPFSA